MEIESGIVSGEKIEVWYLRLKIEDTVRVACCFYIHISTLLQTLK